MLAETRCAKFNMNDMETKAGNLLIPGCMLNTNWECTTNIHFKWQKINHFLNECEKKFLKGKKELHVTRFFSWAQKKKKKETERMGKRRWRERQRQQSTKRRWAILKRNDSSPYSLPLLGCWWNSIGLKIQFKSKWAYMFGCVFCALCSMWDMKRAFQPSEWQKRRKSKQFAL